MGRCVGIAAVIALSAASVAAHHGFGTFDITTTVSFNGALLTRIQLINPHSWLYFEMVDESGKVQKYRCEMRSAHVLRRSGWTPDLFLPNTKVNITASPDRADPNSCYLQTVEFANGSRMDRYGQYVKAPGGKVREVVGAVRVADAKRPARRPTGEPNLAGDWAPEQRVMADPRGVGGGLIRLSEVEEARRRGDAPNPAGAGGTPPGAARGAGPRLFGGTELTERGTREAATFAQRDNPRFRCETTSILFDWTFDGPVNRITQSRNTIDLQYGQLGLRRTIYMTQKEHPKNLRSSRAGHSIGRWEGDTLVVDTVGFLPGVLNAPVRHSDQLHVVERFTLDPKTMRLTRSFEATDPVYLKGTYTGRDEVSPADAPYAPDECKEQQFINYSKQGRS
jgi:hypothetical protein